MMDLYRHSDAGLAPTDGIHDAVWVDLNRPDAAEIAALADLGVSVPSREEMAEIESSSRYYTQGGVHFLSARVLRASQEPPAQLADLAFILTEERLVTVRYDDLKAFTVYTDALARHQRDPGTPEAVLIGLVEAVIDRLADVLEATSADIDELSEHIFVRVNRRPMRGDDFNAYLKRIHTIDDIAAKARINLTSLSRLLAYFGSIDADHKAMRPKLKVAQRDLTSLTEQTSYIDGKAQFLLDALLGLIGVDQNNVMKVLSVVSVALMPPTLLAGIYGMNFAVMPELATRYGYFVVLTVMVAFALGSVAWFRRKGWL